METLLSTKEYSNMDFRTAYIALMVNQMSEHLRKAMMLYQMIQQAQMTPPAPVTANVTVMNPDPGFPPVDLSFLD
jgi:hypothetical protein